MTAHHPEPSYVVIRRKKIIWREKQGMNRKVGQCTILAVKALRNQNNCLSLKTSFLMYNLLLSFTENLCF